MVTDETLPERRLSIGEVAELTGLTTHTLRYYERVGVLDGQVERAPNGHRMYGDAAVRCLLVCKRLRGAGMPLADVWTYSRIGSDGGAERARLEVLHRHRRAAGA